VTHTPVTDSTVRLPDLTPEDVTDSPAYRRVRRDLESLTCGQLQHLKVHVIGVVQRAISGVPVTPPKPAETGGAA